MSSESFLCVPFWLESPAVLVNQATDFFPFSNAAQKCTSTALNSLTRFGLYFGILLAILMRKPLYLLIPLGVAIVSIALYYSMKQNKSLKEGFDNTVVVPTLVGRKLTPGEKPLNIVGGIDVADAPIMDVIGTTKRTSPTDANPFMSVLVNEILDNPKKGPAMSVDNPAMARTLSDQFQTRMYGDPSDVFQHTQNQRTWVAPPITSIPNDQGSFADWIGRVPGPTCKEGNTAVCRTGTEGGQVTWLAAP
jgi:hypothetical protein